MNAEKEKTKMNNPLLSYDMAKLHQQEIMKEAELNRLAAQAKAASNSGLSLKKGLVAVLGLLQNNLVLSQNREILSPEEHLVL